MEEIKSIKDLLDSKFYLLEKFREMAPGTFKHSQNVSILCEAIALEMNLDIDMMKTSGLYHDIGKMCFPDLFSENQNGNGNLHDELDPNISYYLITRHVGDSILLLLQLPDFEKKNDLLNIISQHHGSTILRFFFKKSKSEVEDRFRYKTLPPQNIEAAILMICDSIEATSRALAVNNDLENSEDRRKVVNTTVDRLMQDFQLDDIKVGDLRKIKTVLYKELENIYHKRELYGDEKISEKKDIRI